MADFHRIEDRFTYHAPNATQVPRYELIRAEAKKFALLLAEHCPGSPELTNAINHVDMAVMHANAAIARNE